MLAKIFFSPETAKPPPPCPPEALKPLPEPPKLPCPPPPDATKLFGALEYEEVPEAPNEEPP